MKNRGNDTLTEQQKNLANILFHSRMARGLSLRDFGRKLNISHTYLSKLERGADYDGKSNAPTITVLIKISEGLGITLKSLLDSCGYFKENEPYAQHENFRNNAKISLGVSSEKGGLLLSEPPFLPGDKIDILSKLGLLASQVENESIDVYIIDIKLDHESRKAIADEIKTLIADIYTNYDQYL